VFALAAHNTRVCSDGMNAPVSRKPGAFAFSYLWLADFAPDAVPTRERGLSTLLIKRSVLYILSSKVRQLATADKQGNRGCARQFANRKGISALDLLQ
jgi:hypothetical protein